MKAIFCFIFVGTLFSCTGDHFPVDPKNEYKNIIRIEGVTYYFSGNDTTKPENDSNLIHFTEYWRDGRIDSGFVKHTVFPPTRYIYSYNNKNVPLRTICEGNDTIGIVRITEYSSSHFLEELYHPESNARYYTFSQFEQGKVTSEIVYGFEEGYYLHRQFFYDSEDHLVKQSEYKRHPNYDTTYWSYYTVLERDKEDRWTDMIEYNSDSSNNKRIIRRLILQD